MVFDGEVINACEKKKTLFMFFPFASTTKFHFNSTHSNSNDNIFELKCNVSKEPFIEQPQEKKVIFCLHGLLIKRLKYSSQVTQVDVDVLTF
jgi:hypothetical protein